MQPFIEDIFDKIRNTEVQTEPFDHLVIDNLLPDDFYKDVAKELSAEDFPGRYTRGAYGNKERYGVDITDYAAWKATRDKVFITMHPRNYESLVSGKCVNIQFFVKLILDNHKDFYSLLYSKLPTERFQDNYFFHASMVKDSVGYEIEPHTDDKENIFTILFYAPETDINKEFGLYVCKEKIDFIPNRMIVFAPSKPNEERPATWHEVRRLSDKLVGTRNSFQMFFLKSYNGVYRIVTGKQKRSFYWV